MSYITIFSAPKPFINPHIGLIQRNAILSWKNLGTEVDVILIGDEPGMNEAAHDLGVQHLSDVKVNQFGTPQVDSIFSIARESAKSEILLYINADILLLPDTLSVIRDVQKLKEEFIIVGRRWDLDITSLITFDTNWSANLMESTIKTGKLQAPTAMDYFVFHKQFFQEIPSFAIGRAGWDNWMVYHAVQQSWPIIDITPTLMVIHQNHDYSHLPDGIPHFTHEESNQNVDLGGGFTKSYDLLDVKWEFRNGKIRRVKLTLDHILRKIERIVIPQEKKGIRWKITRSIRRLRKRMYGTYKKRTSKHQGAVRDNQ
jgi:hypothetical protein